MTPDYPSGNTFLTQLMSINIGSREFSTALTKMLASEEGMNTAMSLQGDDALTLIDVLDQAFEAPDMDLDLREKSIRILRRVCGSEVTLPRSCILSENISKEGDVAFASGGFTDVWKGRHGGNRVCVKAFRAYTAENLSKIKQRLFQEIVIWRRLSHPNILPVLGVCPKLFPLCVITEWMVDGNILDFASEHPEVNRLRLLAEAASGLEYLHSMDIIHSDLKPTNILIDRDFHPRLADYGLIAIISDPSTVDPGSTTSPSVVTVQYIAPELLNPFGFGLKNSNPSKKSDIYAFGVVTYQVITEQQPFPGVSDGMIIFSVVTGERPVRPSVSNEWVSDDVWNLIARCWSPSWDGRPDATYAINALDDAADAIEVRRRKAYTATNDLGKQTSRRVPGVIPQGREISGREPGDSPVQDALRPSPPAPKTPKVPSPFVAKTPTDPRATKKEKKREQQRSFRTWHDSTGSHRLEAAFVEYKAGIIHLSSSDGWLLEIAESKLSEEDKKYIRTHDLNTEAQHNKPQPSNGSNERISYVWNSIVRRWFQAWRGRPDVTSTVNTPNDAIDAIEVVPSEPREAKLVASFRKLGVEDSTARPETLVDYTRLYEPQVEDSPERKQARRFADQLNSALGSENLPEQNKIRHLKRLRKLCGTFGILPSSFVLPPETVKCATRPFATGGFSDVYKATLKGRPVAVKKLKITVTGDHEKVYKLLIREVISWRWLEHENILRFVGVMFTPPLISIVSALMEYGNIMDFIKKNQAYNRLSLLVDAVTGLKFLHEHEIVHADLKGANILIDSNHCARVADFGLAIVVEESITHEMKGTPRWMAPELMAPEMFGFTGESLKQLPSKSTDIYAIGMTVFEVLTGCAPFSEAKNSLTVMFQVTSGKRPDRPPLGFSDPLWDLLVETWVEQHVNQPQRRPSVSTILGQLKESVGYWNKTIVPLVPDQWRESETDSERGNYLAETTDNLLSQLDRRMSQH